MWFDVGLGGCRLSVGALQEQRVTFVVCLMHRQSQKILVPLLFPRYVREVVRKVVTCMVMNPIKKNFLR